MAGLGNIKPTTQRDGLFTKTAGRFMMQPTDSSEKIVKSIIPSVVVESITFSTTATMEEIPDGNSPFPAAEYVTEETGTASIVINTIDPILEAHQRGLEIVPLTETDKMTILREGYKIPAKGEESATDITLKLNNTLPDPIGLLEIVGADGVAYEKVNGTGTLATGKYQVKDGEIVFATADAGKGIEVSYEFLPKSGVKLVKIEGSVAGNVRLVLTNTYVATKHMPLKFATQVVIDQAQPNTDSEKAWQETPAGTTIEFSINRPRAGYNAYEIYYADGTTVTSETPSTPTPTTPTTAILK